MASRYDRLAMADDANAPPSAAPDPPALVRLRTAIDKQRDLPATSYAPRRLGIAASNLDIRVQVLANLATTDPAIVVRLLRIANGSTYQTRDRAEVVSVRRAIALLGHDLVRQLSRELPEFKTRVPVEHHAMVRAEIAQTVFATQLVRNLLDARNPLVTDEGVSTVVISRLARICCAVHAPHEVAALRWVGTHKPSLMEKISRELFGFNEEALNREIVQAWQLPGGVLATIGRARQRPHPVEHARDWLPLTVGLALDVAATTRIAARSARDDALMEIVQRYARSVDIDGPRLDSLIEESAQDCMRAERSMGCASDEMALRPLLQPLLNRDNHLEPWWPTMERIDITGVISRLGARDPGQGTMLTESSDATQSPANADQRLAQLDTDIRELIATYCEVETEGHFTATSESPWDRICTRIAPRILDGLCQALHFDRAALFLQRDQNGAFTMSAGAPALSTYDPLFTIRPTGNDLFTAALRNHVDLHIADCSVAKIRSRLPDWFIQRFDNAGSFVLLPLAGATDTMGFILAVWPRAEPHGVSRTQLDHLRHVRTALADVLDRFARGTPVSDATPA